MKEKIIEILKTIRPEYDFSGDEDFIEPLEGPRPHGSSDLSEMSEQLSPFPRPCPQLPLLSQPHPDP